MAKAEDSNHDSRSNQLLTIGQVANELNCCNRTVTRSIKRKKLPALRFNRQLRVRRSNLDALIRNLPEARRMSGPVMLSPLLSEGSFVVGKTSHEQSNVPELYRRKVQGRQKSLNEPATRQEASEILRSLIERILIHPEEGRGNYRVELRGQIASILDLAAEKNAG